MKHAGNSDIFLGHNRSKSGYFALDRETRRRHLYTIGSTGAGKTTLLQSLIKQDIHTGRGVCVIDPHGDLAEEVANSIPRQRINDVVYLDVADRAYPVGFNPMAGWSDRDERELVASQLVGTFKGLWRDSWGEWLEYLLKNTLLALLERQGAAVSLLSVYRMLDDPVYRSGVVSGVCDPVVRRFWIEYFEGFDSRERHMRVSSTLNKAGKFVLSPVLRNIVGQTRSTFDMRRLMDENGILIVNLSKGRIGEDNANFIGSLVVSDIVSRAMQRAVLAEAQRRDFFLYIDEFQNFTTDTFASVVSEARKYRLALHIGHQNFDQICPRVLSAIIKNAGTLAAFSVNFEDAERLVSSFHPIQASALAGNQNGEFWCRSGSQLELVKGFGPHDQAFMSRGSFGRVQRNSRRRYGRERALIEQKFARWWAA